jgi:hypothetical protein
MKTIRHDEPNNAAWFNRAIAPRRLAALKVAMAVLIVAGAAGWPTPSHAQAIVGTEAHATGLEKAFWACDHAATVGPIDTDSAIACGSVTETLKQRRFDGDFGAMLAWWRQHKEAEHLALATNGGTPRTEVGAAHPMRQMRAVVAAPADGPTAGDLSRFALNALLVPLLDDDEPPRWTDVALNSFCGPATRVEIDGKPLVPGVRIPATAFAVRWDMDSCKPLCRSSVELSGVVELLVFHEDNGLSAVVTADRLMVSSAAGTSRLEARFGASMLLVATGDRR